MSSTLSLWERDFLREILPVPLDGITKTFLETDLRLIPEMFLRARNIRLRVLDVARTRIRINRRDIFTRDFIDLLEHRIHGDPIAARHIEDLPGYTGYRAREKIRFHDVLDVCEVARLEAIAVDCRALTLKHGGNEEGQHAAILRRGILSRTEDIEITKRHSLQAVRATEHLAINFREKFLRAVWR